MTSEVRKSLNPAMVMHSGAPSTKAYLRNDVLLRHKQEKMTVKHSWKAALYVFARRTKCIFFSGFFFGKAQQSNKRKFPLSHWKKLCPLLNHRKVLLPSMSLDEFFYPLNTLEARWLVNFFTKND